MKPRRMLFNPLPPLLDLVEQAGASREQLLASVRLPKTPASGEPAFNETALLELLEAAVALTGDPTLALRLGRQIDIAGLGTFGFALLSCADLRGVLQLLLRYHSIVGPGPLWELCDQAEGMALRLNITRGTPSQQQLATELVFSQLRAAGAILSNRPLLEDAELQLSYAAPPHAAAYQEFLSVPVTFGQAHSQFLTSERHLNTPVRTANPAGHVIFLQQCEEMLRGLNKVENTAAAVRRLLIQAAGDFPDISQVAEQLHVSVRTLRRRLSRESTSFRTTCDEVKNVLAKEYISSTELTVAEIAHLLDYTETVNFRRAFVRWNGMTPQQYRNK